MDSNEITKVELERWWVAKIADLPFVLDNLKPIVIKQMYISKTPIVRLRASEGEKKTEYILCVKTRVEGKGKQETEIELTHAQFKALETNAMPGVVIKHRYHFPMPPFLAEIDHFFCKSSLKDDEVKIEVEFETEEEMDAFVPPAWFGKEVTNNKKYSNAYIAQLVADVAKG